MDELSGKFENPMKYLLRRDAWRYQQVPDMPGDDGAGDLRIGGLIYTRRGLLITAMVLLWGVFFWSLERNLIAILPVIFKRYGASDQLIAAIMTSMPYVLIVLMQPIISIKSDRTRGPFGRRKPYIVGSALGMALCYIGLGWSPELGEWVANMTGRPAAETILFLLCVFSVLGGIVGVFIGCTIYYINADLIPRRYFARFTVFFQIACAAAGMVGARVLMPLADRWQNWTFTGISVVYVISFTIFWFGIREGEYPPLTTEEKECSVWKNTVAFCRECYKDSYYWWFYLTITIAEVSMVCRANFNLLFAQNELGLSVEVFGEALMYYMLLSMLLSPLVGWWIDRSNAFIVFGCGLALVTLVNLLGFFWCDNYGTFLTITLLLAIVYTIQGVATQPLMIAVLPYEKYGQFSSASTLFRCIIMVIGGYLSGLFITVTGSYRYLFAWDFGLTLLSLPLMFGLYQRYRQRREAPVPSEPLPIGELDPSRS